ncbi:hypothetical protein QUF81_00020 [Peribacillus simplex]|uniref:Uncharacterized protein n=1 Tax=Peribacillus simplex TaxID=1478 RepID=A0AAW7ILA0_9BACI|nr:hypothetical protein [Peribacillus simplex]AMM95751.1 hypothetical protein UP17_25265 [Peribacillus simplex]MDM5291688.1 hypothetical protein [Peribacillus simplex]MDM5450958.1 hypothetical protein [Peribacillus simplex]
MNARRSLSAKKQTIPNGTYLKEEVVNTRGIMLEPVFIWEHENGNLNKIAGNLKAFILKI